MPSPRVHRVNPDVPTSALDLAMFGPGPRGVGSHPYAPPLSRHYRDTRGVYESSESAEALKWIGVPPPFYHQEIQKGLSVTLAASAVRQEITAYIIPPGNLAMIAYIGNGVGNLADAEFITWSLTVDGGGIVGYSGMVGLLSFGLMSPIPVRLAFRAGQRIAWVASNSLASALFNVSAMFRGWMWSPSIGELGAEQPVPDLGSEG